ncbi:PSME3-interacting protein [Sporobolomyces salmoneus]|uniref:PSME3-interacting protein n=1 Tax=Sporobolomyces salmoneus TaxID=183962 RepID=UPI003178F83B
MSAPPSSSVSTSVSSRFVSSTDLEAAAAKRKEEWAAAYARIGQEPPKQEETEGGYDPRSLWEKLQENKSKKQEAFEEQLKFKNHFRALDEEEISFLDSMIDENNEEEVERQKIIRDELENFRKAVTKKSVPIPPPTTTTISTPIASTSKLTASSQVTPSASTTTTTMMTGAGKVDNGKGKAKGKGKKTLPGLVVKPKKKGNDKTPPVKKSSESTETTEEKLVQVKMSEEETAAQGTTTRKRGKEEKETTGTGKEVEGDDHDAKEGKKRKV